MPQLKRTLGEIGWDGWVLVLCGAAAVLIAILDFTQIITLGTENTLRLLIVSAGLLMGAAAAQVSRRNAEIRELRDQLNVASVELINDGDELHFHMTQSVFQAKKFLLDTTLNAERATIVYPANDWSNYHNAIFRRVQRGEISCRRVEVIFNRERLEYVVMRLLLYQGLDYYIRFVVQLKGWAVPCKLVAWSLMKNSIAIRVLRRVSSACRCRPLINCTLSLKLHTSNA